MRKILRVFVLVLVLGGVVASMAAAQGATKDTVPAYLFSILLGFGTGHYYLQDDAATRFLLLDAGSLAVAVAGAVISLSVLYDPYPEFDTSFSVGMGMYIVGFVAYGAFRVWEIVDVIGSVNQMRAAGKVSMHPALDITPGGTRVGVALSY